MKLYLDPGHGGSDPGAQGDGLKEKDITLDISSRIRAILLRDFENVEVRMSRTSDTTKSLDQRTTEANSWGATYYLSIHCNAFNGTAEGYEDFIHSSLSDTSTTATYQDIIHAEVMRVNQLKDRGQKKANFHILRETKMPALLSENGFIDNSHDTALMKDSNWRQKVAQGHVNGLEKAFKLQRKQTNDDSGTVYKVIAGSFKSKTNAEERVSFLRSKNIESFVDTVTISGQTWYRVQAGAFTNQKNAEKRLAEVRNAGVKDAFIVVENGGAGQADSPSQPVATGYSIMGETFLSPEQMNQFVKTINPNAPELGNYYLTFGEYYGIRGDLAFAQAIHETNYFRFTGTVKASQNNYAGLGATGPDNSGASFNSPSDGVLAHLQHLYAYATTKPLPEKYRLTDPRFKLVKRGSASTWAALNGKWAVPGTNYGESILTIYGKMINYTKQTLDKILIEIKS